MANCDSCSEHLRNYEWRLEIKKDKIIQTCFICVLMKMFPNLDRSELIDIKEKAKK